ncbi:hypothetical protein Csp2054_17065 [Curtobacterium sp. 'Ferrero']|nr:hypothetical protein Csp2054_17065 [Curtobacterium sp. 'Ferrero']
MDPDDDVPGGPGWIIRGGDLRPVVVDLAAFRTGLHGDPLAHCLELLWTGDPAAALAALAPFDRTARVRALRADCLRDLGDVRAAVREYDVLVSETAGTSREAVMRQHRGKALLAAGDPALAIVDFTLAVELRRSGDPVLLASARQGLSVAVRRARSAATD